MRFEVISQILGQSQAHPEVSFEEHVRSAERKFDVELDINKVGEIVENVLGLTKAGEAWHDVLTAVLRPSGNPVPAKPKKAPAKARPKSKASKR